MLDGFIARHAVSAPGGLLALPDWSGDEALAQALRPALLRLCARYLCEHVPGRPRALDPVAHFHLGNGATLQQINWMADTSAKGLAQSFGLMVNYLYEPRTIDGNSESYALQGSIATSPAIRELLSERDR